MKSWIALALLLLSVLALAAPSFNGATCVGSSCLEPPSDLEAWWPGDGDATDIIGGNDGTLVGDATYETGIVGDAFSFDGDGDYVMVPDSEALNSTGAMTIDAWISRDDPTTWYAPVVKKSAGPNGYALEFDTTQENIAFWVYIGNSWEHSPVMYVNHGEWTHVAGVYDGDCVRLYVNGDEVESGTCGVYGSIVPSSAELNIGRDPSNPERFYHGLIDEVDVFSRALTAEEIASIYEAGSDGKCRPADAFLVGIDIVPGSDVNFLKVNGHGSIEVAVLGSDDLNVNDIDINSLRLEGLEVLFKGNDSPQCSVEDVSADEFDDLVCRFADDGTWQPEGDGIATLTGELAEGMLIEGSDTYRLR